MRQRLQPGWIAPEPKPSEASAAQALDARRGRASKAAAPKAGKAVAALLRPLLPQGGMGLSELKRRWADIVGPSYASKSAPEKLAAGTLTLRAPAAIAPFLQQQVPLLIERLRLAGANVKTIRIEQRSAAPAPKSNLRGLKRPLGEAEEAALAQKLDRVTDAGLKSALLRLGRAVKQD
ncbi:MAG: DciA family protein [Hyphomonadaceae bacterium]